MSHVTLGRENMNKTRFSYKAEIAISGMIETAHNTLITAPADSAGKRRDVGGHSEIASFDILFLLATE